MKTCHLQLEILQHPLRGLRSLTVLMIAFGTIEAQGQIRRPKTRENLPVTIHSSRTTKLGSSVIPQISQPSSIQRLGSGTNQSPSTPGKEWWALKATRKNWWAVPITIPSTRSQALLSLSTVKPYRSPYETAAATNGLSHGRPNSLRNNHKHGLVSESGFGASKEKASPLQFGKMPGRKRKLKSRGGGILGGNADSISANSFGKF